MNTYEQFLVEKWEKSVTEGQEYYLILFLPIKFRFLYLFLQQSKLHL